LCHRRSSFAARNLQAKPGVVPSMETRGETPMNIPFAKIATLAFASLVLAAGAASAQEMRKDQAQDRLHDTNQRINEEYREGEISRGQARELKQENREVGRELRRDERDGYLSRGEQAEINRQENAINRQINRDSR
jgi:septal ring factor EnvC (AmiA/AmiB activator)